MIQVKNKRTYNGPGVYIGRGSPLGNPYTHKKGLTKAEFVVESRDDAIEQYEIWLVEQLSDEKSEAYKEFNELLELYKKTGELVLICYCVPANCHGFVISRMIQEYADERCR